MEKLNRQDKKAIRDHILTMFPNKKNIKVRWSSGFIENNTLHLSFYHDVDKKGEYFQPVDIDYRQFLREKKIEKILK